MNLFEYLAESRDRKHERRQAQRERTLGFARRHWLELLALGFGLAGILSLGQFFDTKDTKTTGHLWAKHTETTTISLGTRLLYLLLGVCLLAAAGWCVKLLLERARRQAAQRQYLAILTGIESMRVQEIATKTNLDRATVLKDIERMINGGLLDDFYVDYSTDRVVSRKFVPKSGRKTVVSCVACGSNNEVVTGVATSCTACGEPMLGA